MESRLYRSRDDAVIGGVCGGLGAYLGVDSTFVRIFFILLGLGNGIGVLVYFLLWVIIPLEGRSRTGRLSEAVRQGSQEIVERTREMGEDLTSMVTHPSQKTSLIVGIALIIVGGVYLIQNLHLTWLRWLSFDIVWPSLLILGGLALLLRRARGDKS